MIEKKDSRLTDFVLGELDAGQIAEIQSAIDQDPELAATVDEIRQTIELIDVSYRSEPELELTEDQKLVLRSGDPEVAVNQKHPQTRRQQNSRHHWNRHALFYAAACSVGLAAIGVYWVATHSSEPPLVVLGPESTTFRSTTDNLVVVESSTEPTIEGSMLDVLPETDDAAKSPEVEELIDLVQDTIKNDEWSATQNGKDGQIEAYVPNLSLIISQSQQKIEASGENGAGWQDDKSEMAKTTERFMLESQADGLAFLENDESRISGRGIDGWGSDGRDRADSEPLFTPGTRRSKSNERFMPQLAMSSHDRRTSDPYDPFDAVDPQNRLLSALESNLSESESDPIARGEPTDDLMTLDLPAGTAGKRGAGGVDLGLPGQTGNQMAGEDSNRDILRRQFRVTEPVPVRRSRVELKTRVVETADGPVTESYEVQVPYTENVPQERTVDALVLSDGKSHELARQLVSRVDPLGTREIRLNGVINGPEISEGPVSGYITLGDDDEVIQELEKSVKKLAVDHGIEEDQLGEVRWKKQVQKSLDERNAKIKKSTTWKRVNASPNASRLMIGDDDELALNGMQVNVQVEGFRARVLIDCFYYNDRDQQLEGNFKLRLPDDASLYYFAFGESAYEYDPKSKLAQQEFLDDGTEFVSLQPSKIRLQRQEDWKNSKEARMVPREKAAFAYNQTMRRKVDPALVEWSGAGVFNARVFPLAPKKMHRIVMGYDVNLVRSDDGWIYQFDLPERSGECKVDISVRKPDGTTISIEPTDSPVQQLEIKRTEVGSKTGNDADSAGNLELTRYRWKNPTDHSIRVSIVQSENVLLVDSDEQQGDFWGVQLIPDLPAEAIAGNSRAVFLLDTSLSSNPDKFNVWLKLLRSTLENNRDSLKQFNVLFFDVGSSFWRDGYVDNTEENLAALLKDCDQVTLEGATDLYGAFEKISKAKWMKGDHAADLFLLSDGAVNWGETNLRLIQKQVRDGRLGNLFAYQTGLTGTAIANLRFLANQSGGAVFSVATEDEIKTASTAHRNRPWQLVSIAAAGARDVLTAGRVEWVYPGQSLTIVGRGQPTDDLKLAFSQGDETKTISVATKAVKSELASRLYGQIAVGQLESLGAKVFDVATAYARHFRVTGENCSLLMLESEADYQRFDIKPEEDLFVIKSKNAGQLVADTLQQFAQELADPKAQMLAWLNRLETMPGLEFRIPTALKLALDDIEVAAISQPLNCSPLHDSSAPEEYLSELKSDQLNYDIIAAESQRRSTKSVDEAIKVLSCLVERNPGDLVIARDVAFSAIELERPAQAYPLLFKIAHARPYEASVYPAIGQCLSKLKQADMAIVFYEVALSARFENRGEDFKKIVAADYLHLLREIAAGNMKTSIGEFAAARQQTLRETLGFDSADLLITMMWNTDQTDVDLHVLEPSGEECSYENKNTRIGGHITDDITTGFGPEMYRLSDAMGGKYDIWVKLFGNNQNRTRLRNKVHLTIYKGYGKPAEQVIRKTIRLKTVGEKELVSTIGID